MLDASQLFAPAPQQRGRGGALKKSWEPNRSTAAVQHSDDLARVLQLPRRPVPDKITSQALIELETEKYRRKHAPPCNCAQRRRPCIKTLKRAQAWALYEIAQVGGLIGAIGVGHGKTLLGLLAPLALGLQENQVCVLLCPPGNVEEIISDYELAGQHFQMPSITTFGAHEFSKRQRGMPVLYVMPFSMISRPEFEGWMSSVSPAAILVDEIDKLRNLGCATTARVSRCYQERPQTRLCGWTGSLTDKSLEDFSHLLIWALREKSPLPLDAEVTADWGRALNPVEEPADPGALMQLCAPGEDISQGFQRRLRESMGVIITTESAINNPIIVTERKAPAMPQVIVDALNDLRATMRRPDREELKDQLAVNKCAKELACGFFYKWIYPRGEDPKLIDAWFEQRQRWNRELRAKLEPRRAKLDSEKLCTDAAMRYHRDLLGDGPVWESREWPAWRDIKDLVQPVAKAERLHDYLAQDAAEWGRRNLGIIWYAHREFGKWVAEISGLPLHEGGPGARERILSERGDRSIIVSIKSHGRGRDGLQFMFSNQLITTLPASGSACEQLLGRLHRTGADANATIFAEFYAHTEELQRALAQALLRAEYVDTKIGNAQKLLKGLR